MIFEEIKDISGAKIVLLKVESGEDLLASMQSFVEKMNIKNAVIVSGIGSAVSYSFHVVSSSELPPKETYPRDDIPVDISNIQGYVIDGKVHAHITFSTSQVSFGGHLEPGVKVLTFAIVTLIVLPGELNISSWDKIVKT
uniref:DNA-binding protein n=1 Tax=Fervidobacterium pennivorans TaxID=93466 RepID=A0A7V4KBZ1_FERPE